MLKTIRFLLCMPAGFSVLFYGTCGYAQITTSVKYPNNSIQLDQNPFDFIQGIVENNGQYQHDRKLTKTASQGTNSKASSSLKYHKKSSGSSQQALALYNSLVQQYGQPKSVRGQSHVWDIENPKKSNIQADVVTVILKLEKTGGYELIMDRDRGENGRATWDATRSEKVKAKPIKQEKTKSALVLQVDND